MIRTSVIAYAALMAALAACTDKSPSAPNDTGAPDPLNESELPGLVISNTRAPSDGSASFAPQAGAAAVTYVSAAAGTLPGATGAVLRNVTRGFPSTVAALADGGFDPIPIVAEMGDEVSLEVSTGSSPTITTTKVPPRRPPRVVRTSPAPGRTDVALNVQILVVFSEPVDKSTLTSSALSLSHGGNSVDGSVIVSEDGLTAEFIPETALSPSTTFVLAIGAAIRDLDGDALENPSTITFQTGAEDPGLLGLLAFVSTREGRPHIYLSNPDGTDIRRLTNALQEEYTPAWSPDGQHLAFNSDDYTYVIKRDRSGLVRLPTGGGWPSWSPDGARLLVTTGTELRIVAADGSGEDEVVIRLATNPLVNYYFPRGPEFWAPNWSPNGARIAFTSWTGGDLVRSFVMDADGSNGTTFITGAVWWDECGPVWSPNSTRIALLTGILGVAVVDPQTGVGRSVMNPGTTCWDANYGFTTSMSGIDWSPDGLMLAITKRDPPCMQMSIPRNQLASIVIVDLKTGDIRSTIRDAYDPAWSY